MRLSGGVFYCCDAFDLMRGMGDETVDLICTDPPYKVISGGQGADRDNGYHASVIGGVHNGKIFKHQSLDIPRMMREFYRLLKPGAHCYVMTNRVNLMEMWEAAETAGFHVHNLLRWDKPNVNTNRWYMLDCEYVLFLSKKPVKTINNPGSKQGFPARFDCAKVHPTEKPVPLMRHYIENSTKPGELVFDPFAGCGSTLIAAQRSGRQFLGCELDPLYYNVGLVRLWQV